MEVEYRGMVGAVVFIIAISLLLGLWQLMAISVFWQHFTERLRVQEPAVAVVVVREWGADTRQIAQALARHTRLDVGEIDELVEQRPAGPLPLPLSWRRAHLLAAELRATGSATEIRPR